MRIITHNAHWFFGYIAGENLFGREGFSSAVLKELALAYKHSSPDILCLQEIYSEEQAQQLSEIMEMQYYFIPCGRRDKYNGAVLSRPNNKLEVINVGKQNCDRFVVLIRFKREKTSLSIGLVHLLYPYSTDKAEIWEKHQAELNNLFEKSSKVDMILGDFNMLEDSSTYRWLLDKGFVNMVSFDPPNRVDHVFVRKGLHKLISQIQILPLDRTYISFEGRKVSLSDHPGILIELEEV